MKLGFPKKERLKRQKIIAHVFHEGKTIRVFPLKLHYVATPLPENVSVQAGFSVGKRVFKQAVHRNRIKRLMREVYRLNKTIIFNISKTQYAFMFLYIGNKLPDFDTLDVAMKIITTRFKIEELLK